MDRKERKGRNLRPAAITAWLALHPHVTWPCQHTHTLCPVMPAQYRYGPDDSPTHVWLIVVQ